MNNRELLVELRENETIVIFGCGIAGTYLYRYLKDTEWDGRIVFCDNAREKHGTHGEYEVFGVDEAVSHFPGAVYLILNPIYEFVMKKQLREAGISEEQIILAQTDEVRDYVSMCKQKNKRQLLTEIQFEVDIVGHCNLNCKCCSQFSGIADEEYINPEVMEMDFKRLGELFGGTCKRIYLIGGEPLLHPQLEDCIKIARKYFPIGRISIFTNGLLLLKKDGRFWRACRENRISIIVTKYPIQLDYDKIMEKARQEQIEFEYFTTSQDFKFMTNLGLDIDGAQDIQCSFYNCVEANNCIKLKDGKLYTCTRPAAIYKFNKYFALDLQVSEEDYIDIYKARNKEEILEKMTRPIPFCRYCKVLDERKAMLWGQTEGKLEEWT